jgi:hypothetical protein
MVIPLRYFRMAGQLKSACTVLIVLSEVRLLGERPNGLPLIWFLEKW